MSIIFTEKDKIFTLHTKDATYQMKVDAYGFLLHLYYGKKTMGNMDYLLQFADRGFSGNPNDVGNDRTYSMDVLPQELPCQGTGDYRSPAIVIRNAVLMDVISVTADIALQKANMACRIFRQCMRMRKKPTHWRSIWKIR